jgi:hypothetical protein
MLTTPSLLTVAGAAVGAGAYAQERPDAADLPLIPVQATIDIHRARIEIYCGHNALAVASIRAASRQLLASAAVAQAEALAALELAARLTRQDKYGQAEQALEAALAHLRAGFGPAAGGNA